MLKKRKLILLILFILLYILFSAYNSDSIKININLKKKLCNATELHMLLEGIGDDFSHNLIIIDSIKKKGIKKIRLVNVDLINTEIINGKLEAKLLNNGLDWCSQLNADPHIIIGQGIPSWLSSHEKNFRFGPNEPLAYKDYIMRYFHYVIIDRGFKYASWEVANEPDIRGAPYPTFPRPKTPNGSEQDYQAYFLHFKTIAEAATQFEKDYPGVKIVLGGPAITGGASYRFTKFNWYERFLQDVAKDNLKINFFSFHFYGNRAALGNRKNQTPIPPFDQIMSNLHQWIGEYKPGLPIWITEWGPSSHTKMIPASYINANNVGAAWSAAFVSSMLHHQIDRSFYLLIADIRQEVSWPALFNGTTPKPAFYVFEFFQKLSGQLVDVQGGSTAVGALASQKDGQVKVVVWNYDWQRGDDDVGTEGAREEEVLLSFTGLAPIQKQYHLSQTEISEGYGNPFLEKLTGKKASPDPLTRDLGVRSINDGKLDVRIKLPPSSVVFLEAQTTDLSN